jgi:ribosomal protein S18 acetylase RimI-like enzyme
VIYGGGRYPLNPFYWGIYGGSEFSGFLESQPATLQAFQRNGFKESASSVLFEFDLAKSEPRHLKNIMLKRESRVHILEDENPEENWSALAVEAFHPLVVQILDKAEKAVIARSCLWPMSVYGRREGVSRIGLIDVIVDDDHRRKGYGRLLITESIKCASGLSYDILCVQTDSTNLAAIKLYEQSGFERTETARLFRLAD